ncbi:cytochrome C assembly family protein [Paenibacillus spongiae]|uniref:Cytochrome c biogenesis protein CcsA n=1 Tax=Paenibacillus spongiae TaxID=2909671 RepID=A0ABY5S2L7_9BACL|nr:cytochrome c biogenesis protein CcsA [Paenibacillus spongiae]UVI28134.1 cytochrome c biogenesis protein CcsA [Paenibacillus spongiae]
MVTQNSLYDAMLIIYALSLLFYFSDFVDRNRRAKQMGTGLLIFVWVLQTGFLFHRIWSHLDMTTFSLFENLLFFSWLLITLSLVISRFYRIELFVFIVNIVGFAVLAINMFDIGSGVSLARWEIVRKLLYVHISLMICAYAALTINAIFSGMYVFLHARLKGKQWTQTMRRLPSLEAIDRYMCRWALIGIPLLAMSLAIAVASILIEARYSLLLDLKVLFSLLALGLYIGTLLQRHWFGGPSWKTARWNLLSFGVMLLNLFMNQSSSFHSWS